MERPLTHKEKRQIQQAKAMILADLAHPWQIAKIARSIGLNEKRLKVGFKEVLGQPIGRYIQRQRLEYAHHLIQDAGLTITEASLSVGYANPSHFAFLFKREFGYPPSAAK